MEKEEIMDKVIEILSKHEEHTSEGGIYWEYEWVGGKAIPDGMGGYEQIGGEKVSAEEAFYKEMADFISSELDKAREEGRMSVIQELLFEPEEPSHNISTLEAAFKYEDIIKRYSEEWRNKTKLISPKYIKSKLKQ